MRHLLAVFTLIVAHTAGAAERNLVFILDGSGSMWGRIEGEPKISVAKEVMTGLVEKLPGESRTGLLAYGHRRKGDCEDIESLVALGPLDRQALTERIRGLSPKGKTPITAAVKQAIRQLRQIEESASVVLVSDGLESCGGDPCEAVKAAKRSGVDFKLHVVGFDLGDANPAQLQCMAKAGGGDFYTAGNADELSGALDKAVETRPGLVLEVTSNGEPAAARATLFRAATADSGKQRVKQVSIGTSPDAEPANPRRIALAPGRYQARVEATALDGDRQKTLTELTIPESGEITRTVDFSDGRLSVEVTANDALQRSRVVVFPAGEDDKIAAQHLGEEADDNPSTFRLPPGEYDIRVRAKDTSMPNQWRRGIAVGGGETVSETVDFSTGELAVKVTRNDELQRSRVVVFPAGEDDKIAAQHLGDEADDNPSSFDLPPGEYDIRVRAKDTSAPRQWRRGIGVGAGEAVSEAVDFSTGELAVKVTANRELQRSRVLVFPAGEDDKIAAQHLGDEADDNPSSFDLPPGEYDIRVRAKDTSAPRQWRRGIGVGAGEAVSETVDFSMGELAVKVTANGELQRSRVLVFPAGEDDKIAAQHLNDNAGDNPSSFDLPPGEYDIRVRAKDTALADKWQRDINVGAGETANATVDFDIGVLSVKVTANGELQRSRVLVYPAGEDDKIAAQHLDDNAGDNPSSFDLPPGEYDIRVRAKDTALADKWQRGINVGAGETANATVDFAVAELSVKVTANGELQRSRVRVYPAGEDDRIAAQHLDDSAGDNPSSFQVAPGDYDVRVQAKGMDVSDQWLKNITVGRGGEVSRTVEFNQAR